MGAGCTGTMRAQDDHANKASREDIHFNGAFEPCQDVENMLHGIALHCRKANDQQSNNLQ